MKMVLARLGVVAALVFVPLAALSTPASAGGGGCHSTGLSDATGIRVQIAEFCFQPTVIRVQPGQKVTWTNSDPVEHTVTGAASSWGTSDSVLQGKSVSYRFEQAGVFPYFCAFHPGMVGAVMVGDGGTASTVQGAVAVLPVAELPPPAAAQPAAQPQSTPAASSGQSAWRLVALTAIGLLVLAGAGLGVRRSMARRSPVDVRAG